MNTAMKLPVIDMPKYAIKIPSTDKTVYIRPFTVREEKILLIAQEGGDPKQMIVAIRDIIKNCVIDNINVNNLTSYDAEYIFLKLRARSVGETSKIAFACDSCEEKNIITVDIDKIEVEISEDTVSTEFKVNDDVGFTLRDPDLKNIIEMDIEDGPDSFDDMLTSVIGTIFDSENVYKADNYSSEELMEFINNLPHAALEHIYAYVNSRPTLKQEITFTCESCKKENSVILEGLKSFF